MVEKSLAYASPRVPSGTQYFPAYLVPTGQSRISTKCFSTYILFLTEQLCKKNGRIFYREPLKTLNVILNLFQDLLFQHLLKFRRLTASSSASLRLRVIPAMTGTLQKGFLEVPLQDKKNDFFFEKREFSDRHYNKRLK